MNGFHTRPSPGGGARPRRRHGGANGRLVMGLALLALGLLWTLGNLKLVEAGNLVRWWPALVLVWGLCRFAGVFGAARPLSGLFWAGLGGLLLLRPLGILSFDLGDLWPLILIFAGAGLVFRSWRGRVLAGGATDGEPVLQAFALMGGVERKVVAREFRGGEVTAVLGGASIDLRSCRLAEGRGGLEVFAFLGGIEILVPESWRVIGAVTPIMGGFEDGTSLPIDPDAPVLAVRGLVVMGGVDVKNSRKKDDAEWHARRHRPDGSGREEIRLGRDGTRVRPERDDDPDD